MSSGNPDDQLILRDLETLLQKSIGKEVIVVDYKTKDLLPVGENYASTMLKVDAVIKRNKNSPEEELPLVSKMIPTAEFQKEHFNSTASFNKEFFVFEKLVPMYKQLEKEAGIKDDKLIDILPKFYGGRLTRDKKNPDKADEDAAMLMENLKVRGYYTMNRRKGLDFEHAKYAIENLARFHALGIAAKRKNPEFYSEAKKVLNVIPFDLDTTSFDDVIDHTFEMVMKDSRAAKYRDRVQVCIESDRGWKSLRSTEDIEPWSTIMHGDFWVNNMMFHQDSNGKLDDIKFIDFQLTRITSSLKDLPYYMCASMSGLVMDNHFDELLDIYHSKFVEVLGIIGIDNSPYSKKAFEDQLKKDAYGELFHCLMAVKFFMLEVTEDTDMNDIKNSVMMSGAGDELYMERCWKIVSKFVEKNWI